MIKITKITIKRFRSILNMTINIDNMDNLVAICGENNVGKTNTLRAIDLFFNPTNYNIATDRPTLKQAQGGASVDTKITIEFYDTSIGRFYEVTREFRGGGDEKPKGYTYERTRGNNKIRKNSKSNMTTSHINKILNAIEFRYIASINIDTPLLVEQLTENIIDGEYEMTRMTQSKKALKDAYEEYTNGLQEILDKFSEEIAGTFRDFKSEWDVRFNVPQNGNTFRELISDDVELIIDDKGCIEMESKGSGLQRLAVILLNFEILKRMRKASIIVCIDEPDIYLHDILQRKLMKFFELQSSAAQIFYTTHSKNFINPYKMNNVVLLDNKIYRQHSVRKKRKISVSETILINTNTDDGYEIICAQLGIEKSNYDILERNNLLVEGECDKKYISELAKFYGVEVCKIISMDGVTNVEKYLEFYESYYGNNTSTYMPQIKILFDNDHAGREQYKKIVSKRYINIKVISNFIENYSGDIEEGQKKSCNIEVEDLVYPEIICYLVNKILEKKEFVKIDAKNIVKNIGMPAFKSGGILALVENAKNVSNPDNGQEISFVSSGQVTNHVKKGLAGLFNIEGDRKLVQLVQNCDRKNPKVREFITKLLGF